MIGFKYSVQVATQYYTTEVDVELSDHQLKALESLANAINDNSGPIDAPQMFIRFKGDK